MREILAKWSARLLEAAPKLSHKEMLSNQGFLVYVTRTYPVMVPYLKGFHLIIEMWHGGQDADGWKLKERDDSSVTSLNSLGSLDVTRAGARGLDLSMVALGCQFLFEIPFQNSLSNRNYPPYSPYSYLSSGIPGAVRGKFWSKFSSKFP